MSTFFSIQHRFLRFFSLRLLRFYCFVHFYISSSHTHAEDVCALPLSFGTSTMLSRYEAAKADV